MRAMRQGDYAFFYHSSCKVPGIVGQMEIVKEHSVDGTFLKVIMMKSHFLLISLRLNRIRL